MPERRDVPKRRTKRSFKLRFRERNGDDEVGLAGYAVPRTGRRVGGVPVRQSQSSIKEDGVFEVEESLELFVGASGGVKMEVEKEVESEEKASWSCHGGSSR